MEKPKGFPVFGGSTLLRLSAVAALALTVALPATAAPPTDWSDTNIGAVPSPGSTTANPADGSGTWTVTGSGNDWNGATADALYYVYQSVQGDGAIVFRQNGRANITGAGTGQYVGAMIRATLDPGSAMAATVSTTTQFAWIHRNSTGVAATRDSEATSAPGGSFNLNTNGTGSKFLMAQRVGNTVQGFQSDDGQLWSPITIGSSALAPLTLPLGQSAFFGVGLTSRGTGSVTANLDNVRVLPGVTTVNVTGNAALDQAVLVTWAPNPNAVAYKVYRGPNTAANVKDLQAFTPALLTNGGFVDVTTTGSLKSLAYAVSAVYKDRNGNQFEGPILRIPSAP